MDISGKESIGNKAVKERMMTRQNKKETKQVKQMQTREANLCVIRSAIVERTYVMWIFLVKNQ